MNLEIKNLNVTVSKNRILNNVSFDISKTGLTALVGPSGSGKSTILKAINGLLKFDNCYDVKGKIFFKGNCILAHKKSVSPDIVMVFQKPTPFPISIYKNISIVLNSFQYSKDIENQKVEECLRQVGLWDEVSHRLHESAISLSGGQQQRLCLARAIALNPEIICLDEPCSHLDPISTQKVEKALHELKKSKKILMVTHNLQQAKRVADDVILLWNQENGGEILEQGSVFSIFNHPKHKFTEMYINGDLG